MTSAVSKPRRRGFVADAAGFACGVGTDACGNKSARFFMSRPRGFRDKTIKSLACLSAIDLDQLRNELVNATVRKPA
jgi:hypothetical protein